MKTIKYKDGDVKITIRIKIRQKTFDTVGDYDRKCEEAKTIVRQLIKEKPPLRIQNKRTN